MGLRKRVVGLLPLVSLAFVILAQHYATHHREAIPQIIFFWLSGLAAFAVLLRTALGIAPRGLPVTSAPAPIAPPRWLLLALAGGLGLVAWLNLAGNRFTLLGLLAWIGCCIAFAAAFWTFTQGPAPRVAAMVSRTREGLTVHAPWAALSLLLLLALTVFMRFHQLPVVPPEPNSDHVEKLLDVNDVLNGRYYIFFERNTGREPMQFYLIAAIIRLFDTGLTFLSLKLSNAVMGVVTVTGVYLLGREVGGHRLGFVAAFFVAVSMWAVAPSRIGLRYPFAPAFTSLALWSLLRALRTMRPNEWLVAGLILGAGLYGYTAFRMMPVAAVTIVLLKLLFDHRTHLRAIASTVYGFTLYVIMAGLVFLPLARYMTESPEMFWYRSLTRATSLEAPVQEGMVLGYTLLRTLGMFNWVGDEVWVSALRGRPVLDAVSGGLLVLGFVYTLFVLSRQRPFLASVLLLGSFLLLLPSALSIAFPNESPSVVRAGGAIPLIALLIALAIRYLYHRLRELWLPSWGRAAATSLVGAMLLAMLLLNYQRYFDTYLTEYRRSAMNTVEVADRMRDYLSLVGDTDHMAIKGWPHWLDARSLGIQLGDVHWDITHSSMELEPLLAVVPQDGQPFLFVLHPQDYLAQIELKQAFPSGVIISYESQAPEHDYLFFVVPATSDLFYPVRNYTLETSSP
jgi:4-amino-4-deoxy-L-arabinose transferase-like glycosyltransferase